MTKAKFTDKQLKALLAAGGRKGVKTDFDKVFKKAVRGKNIDKK